MTLRPGPVRTRGVSFAIGLVLLLGACGGGSDEPEPRGPLTEDDLAGLLVPARAVPEGLGETLTELDLKRVPSIRSEDLVSGDDDCVTYLDEDYGPDELAEAELGLQDRDFGTTISQYVKLYDDADVAAELVDEALALLEGCRDFELEGGGYVFEVEVDVARGLDDLAVGLADEVVGAELRFFTPEISPTSAAIVIDLRVVRVGEVVSIITTQTNGGAGASDDVDDLAVTAARLATAAGAGRSGAGQ